MFGLTKKAIMIILAAITLVSVSVATTLAVLVVKTASLVNQFEPGNVLAVVENGAIKNVSDTDTAVYIRVAMVVNYQDDDGNVWREAAIEGTDYSVSASTDWLVDSSNGIYYYRMPIALNASSSALPTVTALDNTPSDPDEHFYKQYYDLTVTYLVTAIQAYPEDAVEEAWGVTLDADGNITAL